MTALKKHSETSTHKERMSALTDPTVKRITSMLVDRFMEGSVQQAEMHMTGFLSEHNLSFKLMDHFSDLLLKLCPYSKIAVQFKCKRTKSKCIVQNSLGPHFHEELVKKLRTSYFSVIIDETTDVSTRKELAIITKVFSGKSVECVLCRLVEVSSCDPKSYFRCLLEVPTRTTFS